MITTGTITTFQRTAGSYPLNENFNAVIDAGATAVIVFFTDASSLTGNPTCSVGGVNAPLLAGAASAGGQTCIYAFGLASPPTGATVAINVSLPNQFADIGCYGVVPLLGTDASSPFETAAVSDTSGSSQTVSVTTTADNELIVSAGLTHYNPNTPTISGTATVSNLYNASQTNHGSYGYTMPAAAAGLYSETFTATFNATGLVLVPVKVSGAPSAPAPPTGVSATPGNTQNTITWSNSSGATSYNIYWSTTSGVTTGTGTKITGVTSPYNHTGLTNGTPYYYIVTAVNGIGESTASTQVTATPALLSHLLGMTGCGS